MSDQKQLEQAKLDTEEHIKKVQGYLAYLSKMLLVRGIKHDASKLTSPELETFAKYGPLLSGVTYASPEYKRYLAEMGTALEHHYANNPHHPEFHCQGIDDMSLVDVLEMFVDWYASTKRMKDGDIWSSLIKNRERFSVSDQLTHIFQNTVALLESCDESTED